MKASLRVNRSLAGKIHALLIRALLLIFLWWTLTSGAQAWGFGVPLIVLVLMFSVWLSPLSHQSLRLHRLIIFGGYFLWQSLQAGIDVARRTLSPRLLLQPDIVHIDVKLPPGPQTWLLMTTLSLLPGTLSVRLHDQVLELHCLDTRADIMGSVQNTQRQIHLLFSRSDLV